MPRTHKPYDATFRQQAVELAQTSGKPYRDVARDLGVSRHYSRWPRQANCTRPLRNVRTMIFRRTKLNASCCRSN